MFGSERCADLVGARLPVVTVVMASLALVLATGARAATSQKLTPSSPVTRGSGYVALGDSVTFGYQEPAVRPAPNYNRPSSFRGYPEQLGTALHLKLANFSCPGETAGSLINDKALVFVCENAYRKVFPLHVKYQGSQLSAGVKYLRSHPGVRLVSLMIGANDAFRCQSVTADRCTSPAEIKATLTEITRSVHRILSEVRNRAHYRGQIVIVHYFSLNYASPSVDAQSQLLNRAQDAGAKPFHVRFADGYGEFRTAAQRFGQQPCLAGLLTQLGTYGNCGVHPSYAGQALLAKAVVTATRL
jgi:lysophospholipase L1-like esterase